ncbi:lipid-A-disaccharide synthase [Agaribacter marinus]|uniref:Lipid-A-disaccharide synthase n=1 Tax=Agaribacter marinus TaxID=1431249 RepID=A0AA37SYV2_9ALTE|nr:lipid-A-disaccharide synthase [Agaribacter marinus]GLR70824.1 lipid-A-disaccharide synthase [Agaribacter marinus]
MPKPIKIGVIAGEASGDVLGAGMLKAIKRQYPDAIIQGIGGQHMKAQGVSSLDDMDKLSVMGLVEVLKHLPELLKIRRKVVKHFIDNPPDVFVGIDAPDFNLPIEKKLKQAGIKTVHYVSPTVWAWREARIHKIAKATNLVLGIFPFEHLCYQKYGYAYEYVGHTLAEEIPLQVNQASSRERLNLPQNEHILALLPGSRRKEIASMLDIFLDTAQAYNAVQKCRVIIPAANQSLLDQINAIVSRKRLDYSVDVLDGDAREIMIASDIVLLTSGTASLEAMLCKRPMVVAYKMSSLTYKMMQRLYIPDYFALPNILADELLVPELLQDDVNPQTLCKHLLAQREVDKNTYIPTFERIHNILRCNADEKSAQAVLNLALN